MTPHPKEIHTMSCVFYLFKDTTNTSRATVRMSSQDPSSLMSGRRRSDVLVPSGAPLSTIITQVAALNTEIAGIAGDETFIRVTMDSVDPQ